MQRNVIERNLYFSVEKKFKEYISQIKLYIKGIYGIFCYSYYSPLKYLTAARYVVFYYEQVTNSFSTKIGALQIPALQVAVLNLLSRFLKNTCEWIHFYQSWIPATRNFTKKWTHSPIVFRHFEQKCQASFWRIAPSAFFYSYLLNVSLMQFNYFSIDIYIISYIFIDVLT